MLERHPTPLKSDISIFQNFLGDSSLHPQTRTRALKRQFSNLNMHHNHVESLLKCRLLDPTARVSDLLGLGGAQWICISNKFPGDWKGELSQDKTGLNFSSSSCPCADDLPNKNTSRTSFPV